jgi:hypothetical protein
LARFRCFLWNDLIYKSGNKEAQGRYALLGSCVFYHTAIFEHAS